jgi:hypothetical protein
LHRCISNARCISFTVNKIFKDSAWAESNANIRDLNTLTLTYATAVYVKEVMLVELIRGGTASKLEVDNNGTFVTVWSRDVNTGANETGGTISGGWFADKALVTLLDVKLSLISVAGVAVGLFSKSL